MYISFYLRSNRIHIFVDALRAIGSPERICFLMNESGDKLILAPYGKRDLLSHKVSQEIYNGRDRLDISSFKLCTIISRMYNWDCSKSYRVIGKLINAHNVIMYDLNKATVIY